METRTEKDHEDAAWREAFPAIDWAAVETEWAAVEFRAFMESAR